MQADAIQTGQKVVVLDDLLATGGKSRYLTMCNIYMPLLHSLGKQTFLFSLHSLCKYDNIS